MSASVDRYEAARAQLAQGEQSLNRGEVSRAKQVFEDAVALAPSWSETHYRLGCALQRSGDSTAAERSLRTALDIDPDHLRAAHALGGVLCHAERPDEAIAYYARALEGDPNQLVFRRDLGVAQLFAGRLEAALETLLAVLEADPTMDGLLPTLAELAADRTAEGLRLNQVLQRLAGEADGLPLVTRIELFSALFRAHNQRGEFDLAFDFAEAAARLKRSTVAPNMDRLDEHCAAVRAAFNTALFERLDGRGVTDRRPIFIVGMPRSGTTLLEQVITGHGDVAAGGETLALMKVVQGSRGADGAAYPDWCPTMTDADLGLLAKAYIDGLPQARGRLHMTDKRLENALHLGLAALMFPNAVFIHCRREPMDMAFSCFTTLFAGGQEWSYDPVEIGRYYRTHQRMMNHWREMLPGRILEVGYEDMVADLEGVARRVLSHCGLSWDPATLNFNAPGRSVRSASMVQVRRPLYDSAIGRWKPFAHRLGPLMAALDG